RSPACPGRGRRTSPPPVSWSPSGCAPAGTSRRRRSPGCRPPHRSAGRGPRTPLFPTVCHRRRSTRPARPPPRRSRRRPGPAGGAAAERPGCPAAPARPRRLRSQRVLLLVVTLGARVQRDVGATVQGGVELDLLADLVCGRDLRIVLVQHPHQLVRGVLVEVG